MDWRLESMGHLPLLLVDSVRSRNSTRTASPVVSRSRFRSVHCLTMDADSHKVVRQRPPGMPKLEKKPSYNTKALTEEKSRLLEKLRRTHNEIAMKQMKKSAKRQAAMEIIVDMENTVAKYLHRLSAKAFLKWRHVNEQLQAKNHRTRVILRLFTNRRISKVYRQTFQAWGKYVFKTRNDHAVDGLVQASDTLTEVFDAYWNRISDVKIWQMPRNDYIADGLMVQILVK